MPDVIVNIEIYCGTCGEGLCNQTEFVQTRLRGEPSFRVNACEKCLERARSDGYDAGFTDGRAEAEGENQ